MKTKLLVTLLGGMLSTSFAMAMTETPDYTLVVSDNLIGQYNIWDSGVYESTGSHWLSNTETTYTTSASVLSTYQSAGQWYQTTQYVTTASYDYTTQAYTETRRDIGLYTTALYSDSPDTHITDSFIDLSLSTSSPMNYSVYAYGVNGSTTSPRGFITTLSPSLGLMVDGTQVASNTSAYAQSGYNSWQGWQEGSVTDTFQAVAEASGGSYITQMYASLSADQVLGATTTQTYSYETSRWTQDVAISAPAPVPEPETYAMLLAGLGLVGAIARRRKQNQG